MQKQFDLETSSRARTVMHVEDGNYQLTLKGILIMFADAYSGDTRDSSTCDTVGYMSWRKAGELELCDYLWMCGLIEKSCFMGNYLFRILPAGLKAFEPLAGDIRFEFSPEILSLEAYDDYVAWYEGNRLIFKALFKGGVKSGSREYWDRYFIFKDDGPDALFQHVGLYDEEG